MEIKITNLTPDIIKLLLKSKCPTGVTVLPFPTQLHYPPIDLPTVFVTLVASVPVTVFINWLNEKLIDKAKTKITINKREIYYDEGEITRLIEETRIMETP